MEKIITKKVVEVEVEITLNVSEVCAIANALNHMYDWSQGNISPTMSDLKEQFNDLSKEVNPC